MNNLNYYYVNRNIKYLDKKYLILDTELYYCVDEDSVGRIIPSLDFPNYFAFYTDYNDKLLCYVSLDDVILYSEYISG